MRGITRALAQIQERGRIWLREDHRVERGSKKNFEKNRVKRRRKAA